MIVQCGTCELKFNDETVDECSACKNEPVFGLNKDLEKEKKHENKN